jgi:aspartate aminotransferase-like enzyme
MDKYYLLAPGPTPLPPEVSEVLASPIIHHRTPQFKEILGEVIKNLKYVFQTENDVFIFASSGTGAMEAGVSNILSRGDFALTIEGGKFGERWTEICKAYGINTEVLKVEWGRAVNPELIAEYLKKNPKIKVVFVTHCETSTGVVNDIEAIAKIVRNFDKILVVDAISSLGVIPLETDNWGIDIVVSGSQKGLMLPPGLSFISVSKKAYEASKLCDLPNYYFSFARSKKAFDVTDTPFTPAVPLVIALNKVLSSMRQEGLENIFLRYRKMAEAVRKAASALGLELFVQDDAFSSSITAIKVPEGIDGVKLVKIMRDEYGVTIAGGQAQLKGKIIRIAHMGYIKEEDIIACFSCLEKVLDSLGYKLQPGTGVKVAKEILFS